MSFYWAAGGTLGLDTLGEGMKSLALARDSETLAVTVGTGVLKLVAAALALALVARWGHVIPRRWLLAAYAAGILLTLYGAASLVEHLLMLTGVRTVPDLLGSTRAVLWHIVLWDPFWALGGILYLLAARYARQSTPIMVE
jgi:hypothetical protein